MHFCHFINLKGYLMVCMRLLFYVLEEIVLLVFQRVIFNIFESVDEF